MVSNKSDRHKKKPPTRWGIAVREILTASNLKQVNLTEAIGEREKAYVNRFLTGQRTPSPETVLRINTAIGKLTKHPDVEAYLDCEALLSDSVPKLLDVEQLDLDTLGDGVLYALKRYERFFKRGYLEHIIDVVGGFDDKQTLRFVAEINGAHRRVVLAELRPSSKPVGFSTLREALENCGFEVYKFVSNDGAALLDWEEFQWVLRRELLRSKTTAAERLEAERRVVHALTERFGLTHDPGMTRSQQALVTRFGGSPYFETHRERKDRS